MAQEIRDHCPADRQPDQRPRVSPQGRIQCVTHEIDAQDGEGESVAPAPPGPDLQDLEIESERYDRLDRPVRHP